MGMCCDRLLLYFAHSSWTGGSAASAFCKSCNCNSSIATRVGFGVGPQRVLPVVRLTSTQAHLRPIVYAGVSVAHGHRYSAIKWTAQEESAMAFWR